MLICLAFLFQKQIKNISHGVVVNLVRFRELVWFVSVNKDVIDESDPILIGIDFILHAYFGPLGALF